MDNENDILGRAYEVEKRYVHVMDTEDILGRAYEVKKSNLCTMEEERDIYRHWIARNKTYCSDEQEMYIRFAKSKKLTVFDHYKEHYIIFDSLDTYWEMLDNTPKEYRCFEEVVFHDIPQSPVIEIGVSSDVRYPGTKIVEILRTTLDTMQKIFRTEYTDYTNIARIPSTLDDFVVMDEIVQRDGKWHYFFHIQTPSFYFPNYSYCAEFRERLCASLPCHISSLIARPTEYIYQLVGISGSYLLSLDNNKRITPYSQFLDTRTSVDKNDLFVSRFSVMQDPTAYELLRLKNTYQSSSIPQSPPEGICGYSEIANKSDTDYCGNTHSVAQHDVIIPADKGDIPSNHAPIRVVQAPVVSLRQETGKIVECNNSVAFAESTGMNEKILHEHSLGEVPIESDENITVGNGQQSMAKTSSYVSIPCPTIFITESSASKFRTHAIDQNTSAVYTAINCIVILLGICKKYGRRSSRETETHRNTNTRIKHYVSPGKGKCSLPSVLFSRKNTAARCTWECRKTLHSRGNQNKEITRSVDNRPKLIMDLKNCQWPWDNHNNSMLYFRTTNLQMVRLIVDNQWDNVCGVIPFRNSQNLGHWAHTICDEGCFEKICYRKPEK
ncbi:uncharacterized protein OCT59_002895 [Rhizophagus irregularis]|nr:hypothetical protein GLOIN_2v1780795 [Rhizophagus irregularis DAOM 181602=DAOM 197198]EXX73500.1 hypothetical protein RirG_059770 [Rhizophagus irregularis DAOM 197198w]UZO11324.1 hypothetical protein OCT59_002895 [Rhizophagus irregularis]POG66216.1 hypothetical protein GLOIN_2v1780795 [Rhizophagus irregularis DAOM 181602=DAOM 197198]CAG8470309.1 15941_t:CDS:1 [Rhizophagus irregularis]GBC36613.2 hypothetical protein GLOIN_2v1780795 [Rhizophagus irregularis DAOM 181602=DAOM 197198]|eukprot:XP_025173082.1 hypothetical protein GLOIN_2v1780795 [Rhizophagus irregularis DAOM 181602=DAOM 197198]